MSSSSSNESDATLAVSTYYPIVGGGGGESKQSSSGNNPNEAISYSNDASNTSLEKYVAATDPNIHQKSEQERAQLYHDWSEQVHSPEEREAKRKEMMNELKELF